MTTVRYLCIVGDIEAQADQAGFELLRAKSARVVLVCGRPGVWGGHRPCSNTYSSVNDGEVTGWWWDKEVGQLVFRWSVGGGSAPCAGGKREVKGVRGRVMHKRQKTEKTVHTD